jgi:hypothetical protein
VRAICVFGYDTRCNVVLALSLCCRYSSLQSLIGQVSNLQLVGKPGGLKSELLCCVSNMLGIRDLIILASSHLSSIRTRNAALRNLPTIISDPRVRQTLGNLIDSDLLHACYQTDAHQSQTHGARKPGGTIVVSSNAHVLSDEYIQSDMGQATLERITTLHIEDAKLDEEGKDFTNSMKDNPGRFIPLMYNVGEAFATPPYPGSVNLQPS